MTKTKLARRRFPRRKFNHPVGILLRGEYSVAKGKEIGEGGMLVQADFNMEKMEFCLLSFKIPGYCYCIVRAEVRSVVEKDGVTLYGLQFLELDYEYQKSIRGHIAAKTLKEAEEELKMMA